MAICEKITRCPFFNDEMANTPAIADIYKQRYCKGDNSECARYHVLSNVGPQHVPKDLYPHQLERAKEIVEKNKS